MNCLNHKKKATNEMAVRKAETLIEASGKPALIRISYDEWLDQFQPIKNHITSNAPSEGTMFETHGEDFIYVESVEQKTPDKVWTLIDTGKTTIVNGMHQANSIGYYVTKIAREPNAAYKIPFEDEVDEK